MGVKKVHLSQHVMVHIRIFELTFIVYFKLFYVDKEVSVCQLSYWCIVALILIFLVACGEKKEKENEQSNQSINEKDCL